MLVLGKRFPEIGKQLAQTLRRMAHNSAEHVVKILPGIDIEVFAGFNEAHEQSRRPAAPLAADKKPVLAVMWNST